MTESSARPGPVPDKRAAARQWLVDHFEKNGPEIPSRDVADAAALAGHTAITLKRAWGELRECGLARVRRAVNTGGGDARVSLWCMHDTATDGSAVVELPPSAPPPVTTTRPEAPRPPQTTSGSRWDL